MFWCSDSLLLKTACFEKNLAFPSTTRTKTRGGLLSCCGFYVDETWNVLISTIFSFVKHLNFTYVTNRENRRESLMGWVVHRIHCLTSLLYYWLSDGCVTCTWLECHIVCRIKCKMAKINSHQVSTSRQQPLVSWSISI